MCWRCCRSWRESLENDNTQPRWKKKRKKSWPRLKAFPPFFFLLRSDVVHAQKSIMCPRLLQQTTETQKNLCSLFSRFSSSPSNPKSSFAFFFSSSSPFPYVYPPTQPRREKKKKAGSPLLQSRKAKNTCWQSFAPVDEAEAPFS